MHRLSLAASLFVVAVALLAMTGVALPRAAAAQGTFTPAPCAGGDWREGDPSFAAVPGATAYYGSYEGGLYKVEIPANWNGELVLYAHGYVAATGPDGDLLRVGGPQMALRTHFAEAGIAWAASSYRCNGYVPGIGLQDTMLLTDVFKGLNANRAPLATYLVGHSMGGHITLLGVHEFPDAFDGALAYCPSGPALFDYFTAMAAAAELVTGIQFSTAELPAVTLQHMLAELGGPGAFTAKGLQMASIMINSSGGPRPFAFEGLNPWFSQTILGNRISGDPDTRWAAMTNDDWVYDIEPGLGLSQGDVNLGVRRVAADPAYRGPASPYAEARPFDGEIATPLMTVHTTGDMYVPIFLERVLRLAVEGAGNGDLLVQRIIRAPQHCGFSTDETIQAFDDMVAWARGGAKPAGDNVLDSFANAGLQFTTPLRAGDPGTSSVSPGMPTVTPTPPPTPIAPRAPATGSGQAANDEPLHVAMVLLGVAFIAAGTAFAARQRGR